MGKGTDKLYITHSEWSSSDAYSASAGSKVPRTRYDGTSSRRLPFNFCAASLQPVQDPVCTPEGTIFDKEVISRWLAKHGTNPITKQPLKFDNLIKLNFARNADQGQEEGRGGSERMFSELVDPVTFKVFTENTHIVAIKHGNEANVFSWETVHRLNIKAKMWRDLVDDKSFERSDILTLQDPQNIGDGDLIKLALLEHGDNMRIGAEEKMRPSANLDLKTPGRAGERILKAKSAVDRARRVRELGTASHVQNASDSGHPTTFPPGSKLQGSRVAYNAAQYTNGKAAASFTSTGLTPETSGERALLSDEELMVKPKRVKIKGYARIETTMGSLSVELQTESAPQAVWNFVQLSKKGYYNGITFHRNIRSFMIQGGDPSGTGKGGQSVWGRNFADEFEGSLIHDSRGILSMANKGKNTNSSQFFITYGPARHLDRKHTIFGRVVGGMDALDRLEQVPVDPESNRPIEAIVIEKIVVFVDPFEEFQKQRRALEQAEQQKAAIARQGGTDDDRTTWTGKRIREDVRVNVTDMSATVGKYLQEHYETPYSSSSVVNDELGESVRKKYKTQGTGFGNFDNW